MNILKLCSLELSLYTDQGNRHIRYKMSILHTIRRTTLFSRIILSALIFSLLLLPLVSWSSFEHTMQSSSHSGNKMEMSADFSINHCHQIPNNIDQQGCSENCCNDMGSGHSCKDCQNSCTSTVFFISNTKNLYQFISNHEFIQNFQSAISSRKTTPPFRPPITLLS